MLTGFSGIQLHQYASEHVMTELYRDAGYGQPTKWHKLSAQATAGGAPVSADSFRDIFESKFMPSITFVDMGELFADHPLAAKVRMVRNGKGASDVPTAQLAVLLSRLRPVAYSHDEHLYKSGVAPRPASLLTAHGAEHRVEQGEHIQVGAFGLAAGTLAGLDYLARAIGAWVGAPTWLTRVLTIAAGALAMSSQERRHAVGRKVLPVLEFVLDQIAAAQAGLRLLDSHAVNVESSTSIESRIAEALVIRAASGPILVREIQQELRAQVPALVDVPSVDELRSVLRSRPCFEEHQRWRYTLGHRYESAGG